MPNGEPQSEQYNNLLLSRKNSVEIFLSRKLGFEDRDDAVQIAQQFYREDTPLARTVVLIPVAAHQEAQCIPRALAEHARQISNEPFTLLLYLNYPQNQSASPNVDKTVDAIDEAANRYPHLDVRNAFASYETPVIGQVRRDLWNGALLLAHHEGLFDEPGSDVIGLNHDIDVEYMSPRYILRVQDAYKKKQHTYDRLDISNLPLPPAGTLVRHNQPENLPNIAKGVFWADFSLHQLRRYVTFEASIAIPFSWYAESDGFDSGAQTYETHRVSGGSHFMIDRTVLKTSPRRYIDRLPEHGFDGIWSDDSFTANDICRTDNKVADITFEQLEDLILSSLDARIEDYFIFSVTRELEGAIEKLKFITDSYIPQEELLQIISETIEKRVEFKLLLAKKALQEVIGSEVLAELVETSYDPKKIAHNLALQIVEDVVALQSVLHTKSTIPASKDLVII